MTFFSQLQIDQAMTRPCGICRQPAGQVCRDLQGGSVATVVHHYRVTGDRW